MKHKATSKAQHSRSHLFMLRVWLENLGDDKTEWRGKVKHVLSGEVRYFRKWRTLLTFLHKKLIEDVSKSHLHPSQVNEGDDNNDS